MNAATLNIGLHTNKGGTVSPGVALMAVEALGPTVQAFRLVQSHSEPTAVVETDRPLTERELFWLADVLVQDAVAQFDGGQGSLVGPNAAAWGAFDPAFFFNIAGEPLAQPAAIAA